MRLTRRRVLKYGLMGGAGVVVPGWIWQDGRSRRRSPEVPLFSVPLPVPPVLEPARTDGDADIYEITQREATVEILPGRQTRIWGYEGMFPGPTIEARRGRRVIVRQTNALPVPTVVHLHGGVTPPESDGYPTDYILPLEEGQPGRSVTAAHSAHGGSGDVAHGVREYVYPNEQRAAMLWYHDHRMDFTGPQVYRGLAGLYIIRDEVEDALPLPRGEREIPLVITDRLFAEDGSLVYPSRDPSLLGEPGVTGRARNDGMLGDTILVNGAPWPELEVEAARYRFRVLNASNARVYVLGLDPRPDGDAFVQIGSDGGLLEMPIGRSTVRIVPAERFDLIVDFSRYRVGETVTLRNLAVQDPLDKGRTSRIMRFRVTRSAKDESAIPDRLAPVEDLPDAGSAERTRRFSFTRSGRHWSINGRPFDHEHIWADPRLDATEIWEFTGGQLHPVHLHLVHFRVLSRNGREPHPSDAGWKDTVLLNGGILRVAARFSGYRGRYVFHCHNLEHEDMAMMANFEVV